MINSTFNPINISEFEKTKLSLNDLSSSATCLAGQVTNIDLELADDFLITGLYLLAKGTTFGDTVSFQVVDVMGTLPNGLTFPPGTVLSQFATDMAIPDDKEEKFNVDTEYPARLLAGMVLRCVYTSTGATDVKVAVNYKLHKILI